MLRSKITIIILAALVAGLLAFVIRFPTARAQAADFTKRSTFLVDQNGGGPGADDENDDEDDDGVFSRTAFTGCLSGAQVVPEVLTDTTGTINAAFDCGFTQVEVSVELGNAEDVTAAHFHCGRPGENGPVAFSLVSPGPCELGHGGIECTLTNADYTGADCIAGVGQPVNSIVSLAAAMKENLIYLNVQTLANPAGEVRAGWWAGPPLGPIREIVREPGNQVLLVEALESPVVTASLDPQTGICTFAISEWTLQASNIPLSAETDLSSLDDILLADVVIEYDWINPALLTPTRTVGLGGVVVPVNGTNTVVFRPIALDDLGIANQGSAANLTLTFNAMTVAGEKLTATVFRQLQVDVCS